MKKGKSLTITVHVGIIVALVIIAVLLSIMNRNVGVYFFINTFLLYGFCVYLFAFIVALLKKKDFRPFLLIVVVLYLFWGIGPVMKFYMDLPDFFIGDLEVVEGEIIDSTSQKAYYDVMINDKEIPFWGLLIGYKDFPQGSTMRIYYLKRSGIGVDFQMIENVGEVNL